ncbi:hypothetical protein Tco_1510422, partial [Tanacetum coccineum]
SKRKASVNLSKNIDADDLLVSGDLSTLGNLYTRQEKENFVLSQVGVDVIAPSMAKDADAHTSHHTFLHRAARAICCDSWKTGTENGEESDLQNEISFLATDNGSLEQGSEDGLMQEDTELTKVDG